MKEQVIELVKTLQQKLNEFGANPPLKVDGIPGPKTMAAKPKPMIAMPVARPRRSGNHFTRVDTGVM